jgi:hypothetical protein
MSTNLKNLQIKFMQIEWVMDLKPLEMAEDIEVEDSFS